jgi:hypothetical protein
MDSELIEYTVIATQHLGKSRHKSMTIDYVGPDEQVPRDIKKGFEVQEAVLRKMGWTMKEFISLILMLMKRKEVNVEDLSPAEKQAYFQNYEQLVLNFTAIIPPGQFGFLGGRTRKVQPKDHEKVRQEVRQLIESGISPSRAYTLVGNNWNRARPSTIKRICQDRSARIVKA